MVAKIGHGSSLYGAIIYNQEKVDLGQASVIFSQDILFSPDLTYNVKQTEMSFDIHMLANKRTKNPVIHISLNPDPRDMVDDEKAKLIAQKYMDSMGYGEQPYLLYKHWDTGRTHFHIVTINVDKDGNKISDKFEKRRSMETCRTLEKEFNLHIPGKKQLFEDSLVKHVEYQKGNLLKQIKNVTSQLLNTYKVTSLNEYKTLLELHGMTLTQVDGLIEGKPIHGIFYSAIDENKKKIGRQLKSSLLNNNSGYKELTNKFKKDKKLITEKNISFIKKVTTQCMYQCKVRSREELTELLKKRGIDLVLRTNREGRTYGVTFVDHNTKTVINGSNLGKEYSANVLNDFFDNPHYILTEQLENKGIDSPIKEKEDTGEGFYIPISSGYDPDEEAVKRKKIRKKGFRPG